MKKLKRNDSIKTPISEQTIVKKASITHNIALMNLPNIKNETVRFKIYTACKERINCIFVNYEDIQDSTITEVIRKGFVVSYNGMLQLYRIARNSF